MKRAAGWYEDEADASKVRYWNGSMWTDIYAEAESGFVDGSNSLSVLTSALEQAKLGESVDPRDIQIQLKQALIKSNFSEPIRFICTLGKTNKNRFLLVSNDSLIGVDTKAKQLVSFRYQVGTIDSVEYSLGEMFVRNSPLVRTPVGAIRGTDFAEIVAISRAREFDAAEMGEWIGSVSPESYLDRSARQNKIFVGPTGKTIEIWTKRIRSNSVEHLVDQFVQADVYQDGDIQVIQRPTMTRMAAGAILPGSALIPGLAFQKKKKSDLRKTTFIVAHSEWQLSVEISPKDVTRARSIASQLNLAARTAAKNSVQVPDRIVPSKVDELIKLDKLVSAGAISLEEFEKIKAEIIG